MNPELDVRVESHVATMTFNRPAVLNALTPTLLDEVIATIAALEADDQVRVLVFTGAGSAFSSGGDRHFLRELTTMTRRRSVARCTGPLPAPREP
jgi:enoyl-CoA hydratase/carnithine racemase